MRFPICLLARAFYHPRFSYAEFTALVRLTLFSALALAAFLQAQMPALAAQSAKSNAAVPSASSLAPLPPGVEELRFKDFFRMPVGPSGLDMTPRLLALDGKRVRIVGYMVRQEEPSAGFFMLTPVPVGMAEKEDGMADDLPPATLFVHLPPDRSAVIADYQHGLVMLTGTLSIGNRQEADGRISVVRLQLDAPAAEANKSP